MTAQIQLVLDQHEGRLPAFTSLGCYPIVYLDGFGETLCAICAQNALVYEDSIFEKDLPEDVFIHWEGQSLRCADCEAEIESAYGDPEEEC